jgi:DNA-binding NarL/FixJ family response regulator
MAARSISSARAWPPELCASKKKRYTEIAQCLAKGLTEKEVANACGVAYHTIKKQATDMRAYFGAATTFEAVMIARREWNLDL